jgi:molybdate transport system ATP-binding protein
VSELSGGERQRVALARALCSRPELLLLDEPLGALDRPLRRRILPYLIRVREEFGVPLVFVSHDATEVAALCDEVVVLDAGRVILRGAPVDVFASASGARAAGGELENVLAAPVAALERESALLELPGGLSISVPRSGLSPGERAVVAVRSDDVLVATRRPEGLSARNVLPARVIDWSEEQGDVLLRLALGAGEPPAAPARPFVQLTAHLTGSALRELGLEPGKPVFAIFKAQAARVLSSLEDG